MTNRKGQQITRVVGKILLYVYVVEVIKGQSTAQSANRTLQTILQRINYRNDMIIYDKFNY